MNEFVCICGKPLEPVDFDAWIDTKNTPGHCYGYYGFLSCSTPGCSGNIKEFQEKKLHAMLKLTDEEKQLLGLWQYPEPAVKKNAFGRWLAGLFHE